MKYLITKQKQVKIFPDHISHVDMANPKSVVSAGKFRILADGSGIQTYGKSKSMGIKSMPEDADLVIKTLYRINRFLKNS